MGIVARTRLAPDSNARNGDKVWLSGEARRPRGIRAPQPHGYAAGFNYFGHKERSKFCSFAGGTRKTEPLMRAEARPQRGTSLSVLTFGSERVQIDQPRMRSADGKRPLEVCGGLGRSPSLCSAPSLHLLPLDDLEPPAEFRTPARELGKIASEDARSAALPCIPKEHAVFSPLGAAPTPLAGEASATSHCDRGGETAARAEQQHTDSADTESIVSSSESDEGSEVPFSILGKSFLQTSAEYVFLRPSHAIKNWIGM